ncbi:unnamed protein product [Sphagnum troendelagicum]
MCASDHHLSLSLPSACFICRPYAADGVHSMLDDEPAIREILSKFQQVTVRDAQLNTLLCTFQTTEKVFVLYKEEAPCLFQQRYNFKPGTNEG